MRMRSPTAQAAILALAGVALLIAPLLLVGPVRYDAGLPLPAGPADPYRPGWLLPLVGWLATAGAALRLGSLPRVGRVRAQLLAVLVTLAVGGAGWQVVSAPALAQGSVTSNDATQTVFDVEVLADPASGGRDVLYYRWTDGVEFSALRFTVRNSGPLPVRLTGIEPWNGAGYFGFTGLRLLPSTGDVRSISFRPVEIRPGEEIYLDVRATFLACRPGTVTHIVTDPDQSGTTWLDDVPLRIEVLGIPRVEWVAPRLVVATHAMGMCERVTPPLS